METFETRAFSLMRGFIWVVMLSVSCFLGLLYLPSALGSVGEFPWQLLVLAGIGISFIILFTMAAFPKVVVDKDGVLLKMGFMSLFFTFDEVRVQAGGYVLRLGNWMVGGWYIPFRRKECMEAVKQLMGVYPAKPLKRFSPTFLLYLLLTPILSLVELFLKHLDIMLNPTARPQRLHEGRVHTPWECQEAVDFVSKFIDRLDLIDVSEKEIEEFKKKSKSVE